MIALRLSWLLLLAMLASQGPEPTSLTAYADADAYDVYNELIAGEFPSQALEPLESRRLDAYHQLFPDGFWGPASKPPELLISDETEGESMCLRPEGESVTLLAGAMADYLRQDETRRLLQPKFTIEPPYRILAPRDAQLQSRRQAPHWWIALSAVGFNRNKTVAVVSASRLCEGLCGDGTFYTFVKKNGKWRPLDWKGASCAWAS